MKTIQVKGKKYKFETGMVDQLPKSNYNLYIHIFDKKSLIILTIIRTNSTETEIKDRVIRLIENYEFRKNKNIFE